MNEIAERFAANLRRLRDEADISQETLAFRSGIHRTQLTMMESARRLPRLDTLVKLAGGLEVEVSALAVGISWTPTEEQPGAFEVARDW
jgi:transcriptional regulator with XRE-family HTH domain